MASGKAVLVRRLSDLLGFEDGAGDVLEHLLSIESSQDLSDYLSQLLGRNNDDKQVQSFVTDVGRFQRNEPLNDDATLNDVENDAKLPAAVKPMVERTDDDNAVSTRQKVERTHRPKNNPAEQPTTQNATAQTIFGHPTRKMTTTVPVGKMPSDKTSSKQSVAPNTSRQTTPVSTATTTMTATRNHPSSSKSKASRTSSPTIMESKQQHQRPVPPKSHRRRPSKGKASVVCGCFGSLHRPLTNCLNCGRISCEKEGYDYCPFCGMFVEQVTNKSRNETMGSTKAWEHKEKLLQYDRDFAKRTIVLDDQADYFETSSSKTWMSAEERTAAEAKQAEHQAKLRRRQKQTLDLVI